MKKRIALLCLLGMLISLLPGGAGASELNPEPKDATEITAQINQSVYEQLDFDDQQELAFAQKGLICAPESLELRGEDGKQIRSQDA